MGFKKLIDSALIVAVLSGASFAVGHMVQIRRATEMGLPVDMLPVKSVQTVLLFGVLNLLLCLLVVAIFVAILVLCSYKLWTTPKGGPPAKGTQFVIDVYKNHSVITSLLSILLIYSITNLMILKSNIPYLNPWINEEKGYLTVLSVQLKGDPPPGNPAINANQPQIDQPAIRLISADEKWVVLKTGDKRFRMIRAEEIKQIELGPK